MADRSGLKFVGFIFATVTLAVMLATGMVVKGYADGAYSLEARAIAEPLGHHSLTIAAESRARSPLEISGSRPAPAPPPPRPAIRQTGS